MTAMFLAAAIVGWTRRRGRRFPGSECVDVGPREGRIVRTHIFLAAAVVVLSAAAIATDAGRLLQPVAWYSLGGFSLAWFLAFRFPRAVGIPVLLLAGALSLGVGWVRSEWVPVYDSTPILSIRVLSRSESNMDVELIDHAPESDIALLRSASAFRRIRGDTLRVGFEIVTVPDQLFFFGAPGFVRLSWIEGDSGSFAPASVVRENRVRVEGSAALSRLFTPGIPSSREQSVEVSRPVVLATYRIRVDSTACVRIERVQ